MGLLALYSAYAGAKKVIVVTSTVQ